MTQQEWEQLNQQLLKTIGQNNFKTWIEPLKFRDLQDGIATFHVPTNFLGNYVSQNFSDAILHELRTVDPSVCRLSFAVPTRTSTSRSSAPTATAPVAKVAAPRPTLNTAPLDKRFTFDSFVVGKPNELAHAAAKRVAEGGPVTFNPLFLYGGVGLGKTHLMHAIAWELQTSRPDLNVLYLSAEQFMYRFVQALRDRKMMDFKEIFRSVDVLMVDDVQFIAGKDSTQEEFFHTFNALV
ncbi:DnaA/Hda family protein, partial [Ascidiaceihabitans sp.]|nr:DnaA/Hda family protein [Ascidiaceihabitans sp.]